MAQKTEQAAEQAARILNPGKAPDRAEQAALDYIAPRRWVIWHAEDYPAGVVRLLARGGLLGDTSREAEAEQAGNVLRSLSKRDRVLDTRHLAALDQIITDAAEQLHGGDTPADVAAFLLSKQAEISTAMAEAKRRPL